MDGALSRPLAERLVETATAAPSMHNSQPWRFVARLADRAIEIYADPARATGRSDPRGRAVHIACGSALFNLRIAVAYAGAEPVTRLLPNPRDPLLLASVRVAGRHRPRPDERDLYIAAQRYHETQRPFTGHRPPPRALLAALAEAAALEGASLRVIERGEAMRMLHSLLAAGRGLAGDPGYLRELGALPAGRQGRGLPPVTLDSGSQLALLSTRTDDRASWLRAGQALQRVLLLAAHRGLGAFPVIPVLETQEIPPRPDPRHGAEYPEMIVRLGHGPALPGSRRPVSQVMRVISPVPARQDVGPGHAPPPALPARQPELLPLR